MVPTIVNYLKDLHAIPSATSSKHLKDDQNFCFIQARDAATATLHLFTTRLAPHSAGNQ